MLVRRPWWIEGSSSRSHGAQSAVLNGALDRMENIRNAFRNRSREWAKTGVRVDIAHLGYLEWREAIDSAWCVCRADARKHRHCTVCDRLCGSHWDTAAGWHVRPVKTLATFEHRDLGYACSMECEAELYRRDGAART